MSSGLYLGGLVGRSSQLLTPRYSIPATVRLSSKLCCLYRALSLGYPVPEHPRCQASMAFITCENVPALLPEKYEGDSLDFAN